MSLLNEQQLALLHTYLMVPIAVGDYLYNNTKVSDDGQYALHEALSEIDPDSALLAIAISAKHIALRYVNYIPVAAALSLEASKIIDDYGPDWLANYRGAPLDEDALRESLSHVPEDLESIADLLDAVRQALTDSEDPCIILCDVLSIQARAHMEIADYILTELDRDDGEGFAVADYTAAAVPSGDNIILFPIHLRQ